MRTFITLAATCLGVWFHPWAFAQSATQATDTVLSTRSLDVQPGDLGLNEAIRSGEAQRRAAKGNAAETPQPLTPQPAYARYPRYTGTIGDQAIHMRLAPKPDERDSVHGEYSFGNARAVQLVTGEFADGTFLMEESDDGTTVTGAWEGRVDARGVVRGQWTDAFNRQRILPFVLIPVSVAVVPPYAGAEAPSIAEPAPMPPIATPRAVTAPAPARSSIHGW